MQKIIYLCLFFAYNCTFAQSNWLLEGELSGFSLSKSFKDVQIPKGNIPQEAPLPIGTHLSIALYRKVMPKFYLSLGVTYQLSRNCTYFITYPYFSPNTSLLEVGYYRYWNYIDIPLSLKYDISKRWSVQMKLSNSFLVGKLDRFLSNQGWQPVNEQKFGVVPIASSERFHAMGVGVGYAIPLKNGSSIALKGFYDYVFLGASIPNSSDFSEIPNQVGIGLAYQIPNIFEKKITRK